MTTINLKTGLPFLSTILSKHDIAKETKAKVRKQKLKKYLNFSFKLNHIK